MSALTCGCDPNIGWLCRVHDRVLTDEPIVMRKSNEVRATSTTGGQKGRKGARFSLVPWDAVWAIAELYGAGALKYSERNWEAGYPWSWSFDALQRHLTAYWQGEDRDTETGSLHIVCAAWHCLTLITYKLRGLGDDDRPKGTVS